MLLRIINLFLRVIVSCVIGRYGTKFIAVVGFEIMTLSFVLFQLLKLALLDKQLSFYILNLVMYDLKLFFFGFASVVKVRIVMKKYHKQNLSIFQEPSPYSQLYSINYTIFTLGFTVR